MAINPEVMDYDDAERFVRKPTEFDDPPPWEVERSWDERYESAEQLLNISRASSLHEYVEGLVSHLEHDKAWRLSVINGQAKIEFTSLAIRELLERVVEMVETVEATR